MRALVISAFALTLLLSAVTVYAALSSSELDGEPYALIAIEPPTDGAIAAKPVTPPKPVTVATTKPAAEAFVSPQAAETTDASRITSQSAAGVADKPKLTPTTATENSDSDPTEETLAADEEVKELAETTSRRTTEVARPVSTTPELTDDPFFSAAEPGLGLGVGNLGPLDPASTN